MNVGSVVFKVTQEEQSDLVSLIEPAQSQGQLKIDRVSSWRTAGIPYAEILVTLLSAGSLAAIGNVIKAWLERKRGKIEITSEKTGLKVVFEGPLTEGLMEQLEWVVGAEGASPSDEPDIVTVFWLPST